jgi:hypothetical protein
MSDYAHFKKRLDRLQSEKAACKTRLLQDLHQSAIDLINQAATVFTALVDAFANESKRHDAWLVKYLERTTSDARDISGKLDSLAKQFQSNQSQDAIERLESEKAFLLIKASGLDARILTLEIMELQRATRAPSPEGLKEALFKYILGPDRTDFSLQAAKSALSFGIGLVPIAGPVVDAAAKVRDLAKRHTIRAASADAHVEYLEELSVALNAWVSAADEAIRRLDSSTFA